MMGEEQQPTKEELERLEKEAEDMIGGKDTG